jgi:hypothetical protein
MASLAGSIAYPAWRSLTDPWSGYSQTWRSLAVPFVIAALTIGAGTGEIASAGDADAISVGLAVVEPSGGRIIPAAGLYRWREMTGRWSDYPSPWRALLRSGVLALGPPTCTADANMAFNGGAASIVLLASSGSGNLSVGGGSPIQLALLAECGAGGVYRLSNLPTAALSRGRMTWRI